MPVRIPIPVLFLFAATLAAGEDRSDQTTNQTPIVMDRVVVSASLDTAREDIVPSLGATNYQIDKLQIDALALGPSAGFNQVLLRAPGVAQDSFGQVHLRGEHADLQYRINDVLLPEGISGFGQALDTRFVDNLGVFTGALPAEYGFRTAGVVDIHTRSGAATPAGNVNVYGGSFGTWRTTVEAAGGGQRLSAYVTATAETSDLGVENPTASRDAIHDHKNQFRGFAYFSDVIDATSRLNLMVGLSDAHLQIPNVPGQTPAYLLAGAGTPDSALLDERQRENSGYLILAWQKTTDDFSAQFSVFTRSSLVQFTPDRAGDLVFNGVASDVRRALIGGGTEGDIRWQIAATHTLRTGWLATGTNTDTRTTTSVFPVDAEGNQTFTLPVDIPDNHRKPGWLGGIYLQDEWKPVAGLTLNYGARADVSRAYLNEGQLSPRLNVVYQLGKSTSVHAGYARYFTPPPLELVQASSLGLFAGTTNAPTVTTSSPVRAERAHYFDIGLAHQFTPALAITLDGYAKRASDLLDEGQFGQALIFSPFNYRRGRVDGTELAANYARGGWSAYANLAVSRATAREIVSGEFQFDPAELVYIATHDVALDHDQRITASAGLSYRRGGLLAYLDLLYGSGLRRGFANTDHVPESHPVNLGLERTFRLKGTRELRLRLDAVNLLDQVYELRDGSGIGVGAPQFGQRRGLYGGLTLAF